MILEINDEAINTYTSQTFKPDTRLTEKKTFSQFQQRSKPIKII